jgi:hypothetical protein
MNSSTVIVAAASRISAVEVVAVRAETAVVTVGFARANGGLTARSTGMSALPLTAVVVTSGSSIEVPGGAACLGSRCNNLVGLGVANYDTTALISDRVTVRINGRSNATMGAASIRLVPATTVVSNFVAGIGIASYFTAGTYAVHVAEGSRIVVTNIAFSSGFVYSAVGGAGLAMVSTTAAAAFAAPTVSVTGGGRVEVTDYLSSGTSGGSFVCGAGIALYSSVNYLSIADMVVRIDGNSTAVTTTRLGPFVTVGTQVIYTVVGGVGFAGVNALSLRSSIGVSNNGTVAVRDLYARSQAFAVVAGVGAALMDSVTAYKWAMSLSVECVLGCRVTVADVGTLANPALGGTVPDVLSLSFVGAVGVAGAYTVPTNVMVTIANATTAVTFGNYSMPLMTNWPPATTTTGVMGVGIATVRGECFSSFVRVLDGPQLTVANVTMGGYAYGVVFGAGFAMNIGVGSGSQNNTLTIRGSGTVIDVSMVRSQPGQLLRGFVGGAGIAWVNAILFRAEVSITSGAAVVVRDVAFPTNASSVTAEVGAVGAGFAVACPNLISAVHNYLTVSVSGSGTRVDVVRINAPGAGAAMTAVGAAVMGTRLLQWLTVYIDDSASVAVHECDFSLAVAYTSVGLSAVAVEVNAPVVHIANRARVTVSSFTLSSVVRSAVGGVGVSCLHSPWYTGSVFVTGAANVTVSNLIILHHSTADDGIEWHLAFVAAVGCSEWAPESEYYSMSRSPVIRIASGAAVTTHNVSLVTSATAMVGGVGFASGRCYSTSSVLMIYDATVTVSRLSHSMSSMAIDELPRRPTISAFVGAAGFAANASSTELPVVLISNSVLTVLNVNVTVTGAAVGGAGVASIAPPDRSMARAQLLVGGGSSVTVGEAVIIAEPQTSAPSSTGDVIQSPRMVRPFAACAGILLDGVFRGATIIIDNASLRLVESDKDPRHDTTSASAGTALVALTAVEGYYISPSDATGSRILVNVSGPSYLGPCPPNGACLLTDVGGAYNNSTSGEVVVLNVSIGRGAVVDACPPRHLATETVDLRPRIAVSATALVPNVTRVSLSFPAVFVARRSAAVLDIAHQQLVHDQPGALIWRPCTTFSHSASMSLSPGATTASATATPTHTARTVSHRMSTGSRSARTMTASETDDESKSASPPRTPTASVSQSDVPTRSASVSMTSTATIPFVFPIPELVQAPTVKTGGAVAASGATSAVLAGALSSGGAAAGGIARTLGVVAALGRIASSSSGSCKGADADATLMATDSPLQLTLGHPPDYVTGAAVGAPAMVLAVGAFCAVVSLLGRWILRCAVAAPRDADVEAADEEMATKLHIQVPSAGESLQPPPQLAVTEASLTNVAQVTFAGVFLALSMLTTPAVTYALMRAVAESDTADPAMARWRVPLAGACALLMCAALLGFSVAAAVAARPGGALRFVAFKPPRPAPSEAPLRVRLRHWWRRAWRPEGEWVESSMAEGSHAGPSSDVSWGSVLLSVVDGYRGPRAWFCVVDAAFQVLLGVAGAAAEFTADDGMVSCVATAWATVAASAVYVALLVAARPHRTRAQWYTVVLANALVLAIAFAMALVVQRAWADGVMPDYTTLLGLAAAAQCLAFMQAIQELALQIVDLIAAWRGGTVWQYLLRSQRRRQKALATVGTVRTSQSVYHGRPLVESILSSCQDVVVPAPFVPPTAPIITLPPTLRAAIAIDPPMPLRHNVTFVSPFGSSSGEAAPVDPLFTRDLDDEADTDSDSASFTSDSMGEWLDRRERLLRLLM